MAILELEGCDAVIRTMNDSTTTFQPRKLPSWPRARTRPGGRLIFEIFETPSAGHGAFSFLPTMAILDLKSCGAVVRTMNDSTTTFQRRKLSSWPRVRTRRATLTILTIIHV
jgi:hypothetical protein